MAAAGAGAVQDCMLVTVVILCGLAVAAEPGARTAEPERRAWIHLNGYSHHFSADGANDRLWGAGFTLRRSDRHGLRRAWETDVFLDSGRRPAAYAGQSWAVQRRPVSFGATGAIMHHRNFSKQNRLKTMPVALPFLEFGSRAIKLRLYYVPPVRSPSDHQVAIQLLVPIR